MQAVTLSAHFDGKQILLDEPYTLAPNTKLIVTVLSEQSKVADEREAWLRLSRRGLEKTYGEDEVEYTSDMIKRPNPDYDKRR